ncbi:MAG: tetratricopeptide repeat protein [bacterium]|nr:tetratricopeptide repeat protein [bacterium]
MNDAKSRLGGLGHPAILDAPGESIADLSQSSSTPERGAPSVRVFLAVAAMLVAVSTLPYVAVLDGGFFYDDWRYFLDGSTESGATIRPAVSGPLDELLRVAKLRSLTFLTYRWDYLRGGADPLAVDPRPFHTTSLLIHALAVLALWSAWLAVARRLELPAGFETATLAAALFGTHPLVSEAVNYPAARGSSLAALFTFAAIALFVSGLGSAGLRRVVAWGGVALAVLLSTYSKEVGAFFPWGVGLGVFYVTEVGRLRARWADMRPARRWLAIVGPPAFVALLLLWLLLPGLEPLRPAGLEQVHYRVSQNFAQTGTISNDAYGLGQTFDYSATSYWLTQTRSFVIWLSLVVAPWGRQTIDHPIVWSSGPFGPWTTLPAILAVCGLALFALLAPATRRPRPALAGLGVWVVFVGLGPNSLTPGLQPLLEYRYVVGLAGATLILAAALAAIADRPAWRRPALVVAVALPLILAASTAARNSAAWRDAVHLWTDAARKAPDRLRPRNELAMAHYHARARDPEGTERAVAILRELRTSHPHYIRGLSNLGGILADRGETDEAIAVLEQMIARPQVVTLGVVRLGLLYEKVGRSEDALALWREGGEFDPPQDALSQALRARLAALLGHNDEVIEAAELFWRVTERRRTVDNAGEVAILHASALFQAERLDEAFVMAEQAERVADTFARRVRSVVLRGDVFEAQGRDAEAAARYDRAIGMMLEEEVLDPIALMPIGDAAMKAHLQAKQADGVAAAYARVMDALPEPLRERWRDEHAWMTRVTFGN